MTLNDIMDFDQVIHVDAEGNVTTPPNLYAPTLYDDELVGQGWELLNGFSGQDRYVGPLMHASEFIGGGLERYILENPGFYVNLVNYLPDEEESENWAIAFRPDSA